MTVTYGFYDSLAGDRKYNANQMSRLFEGIITDGIFQSIGSAFVVTPNTGMTLNVAAGRAWFNYTWTNNDGPFVVTVQPSEAVLNRVDTVVIEVNTDLAVRANTIKVIKGTPASSPLPPVLADTSTLHQYGLADVYVGAGVTTITGGFIFNRIGTVDTPFITGILESIDVSTLLGQFQTEFDEWFNNLVDQLTGTQVTNLQAEIDLINGQVINSLNYIITPSISSNNLVLDIKYLDGGDPSAIKPISFRVGNLEYLLTAAAGFTKNAGTNWMNLGAAETAANPVDLFVYAIGETGASAGLKFGYSRLPYATMMGDFTNTATSERFIASNVTNFNSTDAVTVIGRFRAQLSAGAGYTWSIATGLVINRPIFETAWLTYVPTWASTGTAVSKGNAIIEGRYKVVGTSVKVVLFQTMGSTTTFGTGTYNWSLPFTAATWANAVWQCNSQVVDVSPLAFYITAMRVTSASNVASIASNAGVVAATVPFTWAANDVMNGSTLEYQI